MGRHRHFRRIDDHVISVEEVEYSFPSSHRALKKDILFGHVFDGRIEHSYQVDEGDERSQRDRMGEVEPGADTESYRRSKGRQEIDGGPEGGENIHFAQVGFLEGRVMLGELGLGRFLPHKEFHDLDAGEVFRYKGVNLACPLPLVAEGIASAFSRDVRDDKDEGDACGDDEGKAHVEKVEDGDGANHDGGVLNKGRKNIGEEIADRFDVACHPCHEASNRLLGKVCHRTAQDMAEKLHTEVFHHFQAQKVAEIDHDEGRDQDCGHDDEEKGHVMPNQGSVSGAQARRLGGGQRPELFDGNRCPTAFDREKLGAGGAKRRLRAVAFLHFEHIHFRCIEEALVDEALLFCGTQAREPRCSDVDPPHDGRIGRGKLENLVGVRTHDFRRETVPGLHQRIVYGAADDDGAEKFPRRAYRESDECQYRDELIRFYVGQYAPRNGPIKTFRDVVGLEEFSHAHLPPLAGLADTSASSS